MAKITGLGGVFVGAKDQDASDAWYKEKLGINIGEYGATFFWRDDPKKDTGMSVFCHFKEDSDYFKPGHNHFMLNFRVDNLEDFIAELKEKGVGTVGEMVVESYGKFAWVMDPAGTKVELWEEGEAPEEDPGYAENS